MVTVLAPLLKLKDIVKTQSVHLYCLQTAVLYDEVLIKIHSFLSVQQYFHIVVLLLIHKNN